MSNNFNIDKDKLNSFSKEEREVILKILEQYGQNGDSALFNKLVYNDYEEIPVDIETFLTDDNYMGQAWKDAEGKLKIYPYWMKRLKELFPNNLETKVNTFIASGARGLGKSEISIAIMCYLLYRVMCLKNPLEHFHLKPTEKIVFALMNIKLALVEEIATSKFQNSIKMSPWFMKRGHITGKSNLIWEPDDKYNIDIKIGSQSDDLIGLPIYFCLDGDTEILTTKGVFKLKDLENKEIQVLSMDKNNNIVISNTCTIKPTVKTQEEYEIELEDGTIIKCTPNHRFMLKDGSYKEAQELTENDELMDIKPFGYIYKFTNLKTNKIYIGKREKSFFDESYYGSGKLWKKDLDLYGKEFIKREIICFGYSRKELNTLEKKYIKLFNSQDQSIGYNIHKGGQGGNSLNDTKKWSELHTGNKNGRYGKEVSIDTRLKISKSNKGKVRSEEFKKQLSKKLKNRKKPDGFGDKISRAQKGRKKSELELLHLRESNKIIAEKNRGKKRSAETRNKISKSLLGHKGLSGKDNPMYGKSHSKEAREKISKAKKGKYTLGNSPNSKCVICIDTGEMFTSIKEATLKYPKATHISDCCKNIIKSSGKLHWRYKDEN